MNRREAERRYHMFTALRSLGFTQDEAEQLRRISLTLGHWAERECNEDICRGHMRGGEFHYASDEQLARELGAEIKTWVHQRIDGRSHYYRIPNREAGALRRLKAILEPHKRRLTCYHQTDPCGAALYIIPLAKLRQYNRGNAQPTPLDSCYPSVGIAVY